MLHQITQRIFNASSSQSERINVKEVVGRALELYADAPISFQGALERIGSTWHASKDWCCACPSLTSTGVSMIFPNPNLSFSLVNVIASPWDSWLWSCEHGSKQLHKSTFDTYMDGAAMKALLCHTAWIEWYV